MIFIRNKYTRVYYNIIDRATSRNILGYTEKHHIIPRSLGGSNDSSNLVALTAKEHFICHLLLTRMTQGQDKNKMVSAVFYLTGKGKADRNNRIKSSRLYQNLKEKLSAIVSEQKKGCKQPERSIISKKKYSESKLGKKNPKFKGYFITPWGTFESSGQASKSCPKKISAPYIVSLCIYKNNMPINLLSVCRSKEYLTKDHIGKTPADLGFSFSCFYK